MILKEVGERQEGGIHLTQDVCLSTDPRIVRSLACRLKAFSMKSSN